MGNQDDNVTLQLLQTRTQKLERWLRLSAGVWLLSFGLVAVSAWTWQTPAKQSSAPASLRVSELVVVDPKGVERVRIGGDLPDAIIAGKRVPRGEKAAGVLLYDGAGQERSGYVTFEPSGNVGLTLDTKRGQVAIFVAGPDTGSALQLWHGRDSIEFRSDEDGSRLTAVKAGEVVSQEPAVTKITSDTCEAYRSARSRVSAEQVMRDCRRRFNEAACRPCLNDKP
jgi:hypothetical protein